MGKQKGISKQKAREMVISLLRGSGKEIKKMIGTEPKMNTFNLNLGLLHKQIQAFKLPVGNNRPHKYYIRVSHNGSFEYYPYDKRNTSSQLKVILASALKVETASSPLTEELKLAINDALVGTTVATPVNIGENVAKLLPIKTLYGTAVGETSSDEYMSFNSGSETETPTEASQAGPSQAGPSQAGPSQAGPSGVSRVPINLPATRPPKRTQAGSDGSNGSENENAVNLTTSTPLEKKSRTVVRGKGKKPAKKNLLEQQNITSALTDQVAEVQSAIIEGQQALVEAQQVAPQENLIPEQTVSATMDGNDPAGGAVDAVQPVLGPITVSGPGAVVPQLPAEIAGQPNEPPRMEITEPVLAPIMDGSASNSVVPTSPYNPQYYHPPNMRMRSIDTARAQQMQYDAVTQRNRYYANITNDQSVNIDNYVDNLTTNTDARTFNDMRTTVINNGVSALELDASLMRLQNELHRQNINNQQFIQYAQTMFIQGNQAVMTNLLRGNEAMIDSAISRVIAQVQDAIEAGLPSSPNSSSSSDDSSSGGGGGPPPPPPINAGGDTSIGQPINSMGTTQTPSSTSGGSEQLLRQILEILTIQNSDKLRAIALAKNADQYTPKSSTGVNLPRPQVLPLENARGRQVIDSDYVVIRPRWG